MLPEMYNARTVCDLMSMGVARGLGRPVSEHRRESRR